MFLVEVEWVYDSFVEDVFWVLVVVYKKYLEMLIDLFSEVFEIDLMFVGMVGMIDLLRLESKVVVLVVKKVGIKIVMIIGDYIVMVLVIVKEIGILMDGDKVIIGVELVEMLEVDLEKNIWDYVVYVCVSLEDKIWIVKVW